MSEELGTTMEQPNEVQSTEPIVEQTTTESEVTTPEATTEPVVADAADYSWVPAKFLVDGEPDFQGLAKAHRALEKKIGSKGAMAPESIDEYTYTSKAFDFDDELLGAMKAEAMSKGISKDQYEWMMSKYEDELISTAPTAERAQEYLQKAWGNDFEKNSMYARRAYEVYVPSDIPVDAIGNNPYVIDILARIGAELDEDSSPRVSTRPQPDTQEVISSLIKDPNYYNSNKEGEALRERVSAYYASKR